MLLDVKWQRALIPLSLYPILTSCTPSPDQCTWKTCGWIWVVAFIALLLLIVLCACIPKIRWRERDDQVSREMRAWYGNDDGEWP
jgi:heme/copper-type cytochrome/quinol oxidase subunit 2